jgi:hypothetical protein
MSSNDKQISGIRTSPESFRPSDSRREISLRKHPVSRFRRHIAPLCSGLVIALLTLTCSMGAVTSTDPIFTPPGGENNPIVLDEAAAVPTAAPVLGGPGLGAPALVEQIPPTVLEPPPSEMNPISRRSQLQPLRPSIRQPPNGPPPAHRPFYTIPKRETAYRS